MIVQLLPDNSVDPRGPPPLLDFRGRQLDDDLEPVQLLEGIEYRYVLTAEHVAGRITNDHPELFLPDDDFGRAGRLRPAQRVGLLNVAFRTGNSPLGTASFEVRARRLEYATEFRWMLRDIAELCAEAVLEAFAPTEQRFALNEDAAARTAYQRFSFLRSLLRDETFAAAVEQIRRRPYVAWAEERELRLTSQGLPASSRVAQYLTRPGPRLTTSHVELARTRGFPQKIEVERGTETLDNPPNRFVRFAFERWRDEVTSVLSVLTVRSTSASVRRGLSEASSLLAYIDDVLRSAPFNDVSRLERLPLENPVLARREGYRDVVRAFFQSDLAAKLAWSGGEFVYAGGQRSVAVLYEYWVYLRLAEILSSACDTPLPLSSLLSLEATGLHLRLAQGIETRIDGHATRRGRRLRVSFWYNRTFPTGSQSWTKSMRPDCSLQIAADGTADHDYRSVWVHFDAKYRIEDLTELFGSDEETITAASTARRDDLLKMHAYRDAIRRSAGAFVVYPGTEDVACREYHELLPGLGAFPLRPAADGDPMGAGAIRRFVNDVLDHVAAQTSQHERHRYWRDVSYREPTPKSSHSVSGLDFLEAPPADVLVLLGYVRSTEHAAWIAKHGLYNIRADGRTGSVALSGRELSAQYVWLYSVGPHDASLLRVSGNPRLMLRRDMNALSYPNPRGDAYFCIPVAPANAPANLKTDSSTVMSLRNTVCPDAPAGAPVVVSWDVVMEFLGWSVNP